MLEELTQEHRELMIQVRDEWLNRFFDNVKEQRGIDKPLFEDGIAWLYDDIIHKPKPKIIYCDSWVSCLISIATLEQHPVRAAVRAAVWDSVGASVGASVGDSVWASVRSSVEASVRSSVRSSVEASVRAAVWDSVGDSVWASVRASVGDSVWASVGASVGDSVGDSVWASVGESVRASVRSSVGDSVGDSVWSSVWASVGASVGDSVWSSVRSSVEASVRSSVRSSVEASVRSSVGASVEASVRQLFSQYSSYYGDISDFGWIAFYDFFSRIGRVNDEKFEKYKSFIKSCTFAIYPYENYVFAIQPPIYIERNAAGRLHSTTGPAVKFRDGTQYFFINGRNVPEWIIKQKERITRDKFLSEKNAEIKGAMYEVLGQQGIMNLLGAEAVDIQTINHANGAAEIVELLKTRDKFKEIDNQPFAWVKVICPSTGTNYLLGVEPHHTDAVEALASLSMFDKSNYSFDHRT